MFGDRKRDAPVGGGGEDQRPAALLFVAQKRQQLAVIGQQRRVRGGEVGERRLHRRFAAAQRKDGLRQLERVGEPGDNTFDQRIGANQAAVEVDDQRPAMAGRYVLRRREGRRAHPNASSSCARGVVGRATSYRGGCLKKGGGRGPSPVSRRWREPPSPASGRGVF